ncbi:MAG: glutathione synthase [Rhodospirillales bacterium]|nr:glutathione synthase [Rhodospirillales bacterium]
MPLHVAIQMDPIEAIDIDADSTFALGLEAQTRGHRLWFYPTRDLAFSGGRVTAKAQAMTLRREYGNHVTLAPAEILDLGSMDAILMRQDPPFDLSYITATHILEQIHPKTLVVNDPVSVRNAPEKLFVTRFPELMPPTLITASHEEILRFREEHRDVIVKPLYGNGGAGVFHIAPGDENLRALLELFSEFYREPIIVQRYLPEVRKGDKRIVLVDGEAVGAINRVPAAGEARSNMHAGGRAEASRLTARERAICRTIGPALQQQGMLFAGIDVIGGYLTEINVTSPTGIQEIGRFDGSNPAGLVWDAIERRRQAAS